MTNPRTLVLLLLAGCTSSADPSVDVDLDNTDASGKADSIGSRHITAMIQDTANVSSLGLGVEVLAATEQTEVVRSWLLSVVGTDESQPPPGSSVDVSGEHLLKLTATPQSGQARFGLVLFTADKTLAVSPQNVVVCRRGNLKATYFRSLSIDYTNRAFYADDQTWSFSECGLDSSRNFPTTIGGHRYFLMVAMPVVLDNPTGSLVGNYSVDLAKEVL